MAEKSQSKETGKKEWDVTYRNVPPFGDEATARQLEEESRQALNGLVNGLGGAADGEAGADDDDERGHLAGLRAIGADKAELGTRERLQDETARRVAEER